MTRLTTASNSIRQSMARLHTWAGLLPGWLLFLVFLFGTNAFFQQEISRWMRPELDHGAVTLQAMAQVDRIVAEKAHHADTVIVSFPDARGDSPISVSWRSSGDSDEADEVTLAPATGRAVTVRQTQGGWFLYRFHYDLHYLPIKWARLVVCICSLAMLVAIFSGVVTHKKIFADFFQLRFGKGQRSWLDAHNATAVLMLPFHLMITYTGLAALLFTLMPWVITANFPSERAYLQAAFPSRSAGKPHNKAATLLPLGELMTRASQASGGLSPTYISITNASDATALAEFWFPSNHLGGYRRPLYLSAVTGVAVESQPRIGSAQAVQRVMIDLHAGRFADPMLRWLYFLSGVGGTAMVATGLVLWTAKRRAKLPDPSRPHVGCLLVERLNIGVMAGSCLGIAVYFLANRLLPLGTAHRADWEINSLFIAWGGVFAWALVRPARRAWIEALTACAAFYALVPVVNAITSLRGLVPSLAARNWVFVGFDLAMLVTAAAFALAARKVASHRQEAVPRQKMRVQAEGRA
ncbi:PepSY-associated TM helix domain-containing protein (plasmid) [Sphingobium sp. V4]|uniref:PepSY-associated TM helix domain-containing protein n=1 Tax=Sphingobium sp. V4 TaxID=3038927 RepID=UPI00255817DB|nr:PepSY-associated TM helix domain-containing protein [Sphingobium sp. V4]WIW90223.1 PepSY-associated TM helix domain-containing protein [Sphingobium sp. V4]